MDKVNIITLGCPKNLVDSERMLGLLEQNDYEIADDPREAQLIIVNTCGFIRPAVKESIETIMEAAQLKMGGNCRKLIVAGCLAERYRKELERELAEADRVIGLADRNQIVRHCDELLGRGRRIRWSDRRHLMTPRHWAYLRISDGCDHLCSFCTIPSIRGRHRSESIESLIREAECLAEAGVRELVLVAQDSMRYGVDIYGAPKLAELIRILSEIRSLRWIRLLYAYPAFWSDELIEIFAENEKVCRYLDIPIQHICDEILRRMRRGTSSEGILRLIEKLRSRIPGVVLRTSLIVGFPGETEAHFQQLMDFVREIRFERLGAFVYSREEGTLAAQYKGQVPEEVKRERLDRLMALQQEISREFNESLIGEEMEVLVEEESRDPPVKFVGRTEMDAPEVDGEVLITEGKASVGEFVRVVVREALEYDLVGEVVSTSPGCG